MAGWLELAALLAAAAVAGRWWWVTHPLVRCLWCGGSGKNRLSTRWREGKCRHCGGTGRHDTRRK